MLRRSVILLVGALLLSGALACNMPALPGLPSPDNSVVSPMPQESPTSASVEPAAGDVPVDAATSPIIALATVAEPVAVKDAAGTSAESVESEAVAPTMEVRFNTPTRPAAGISTPEAPPLPTGAAGAGSPVATIVATVQTVASPTLVPTIPLPTPIPLPAPVVTVPVPAQMAADAPQIIWIEDLPGRPQSAVMAWRGGVSRSVFGDEDRVSRVLEFNVSADGTWLAYTTVDSSSIQQVNTITGEKREIAPKHPGWCFRFPSWSPGGALLAFVAAADSAPWAAPEGAGLWMSQPDGTDIHQLGKGIGWANQNVILGGWEPRGQDLVYSVPDMSGTLLPQWFTAAVETGEFTRLPLRGSLYDVAPDGSWLLGDGFTDAWPEGRKEISSGLLMRIPVDGSAPQVLTPACRSEMMGQVSPDGTRIALLSMPSLGFACPQLSGTITYELWVMNSDGTDRRQIEVEGLIGSDSPQWSPDGSAVYYSAWEPKGSSLWMADASAVTPPVRLEQTEGVDRFTVVK